jgi:hypothetical protein
MQFLSIICSNGPAKEGVFLDKHLLDVCCETGRKTEFQLSSLSLGLCRSLVCANHSHIKCEKEERKSHWSSPRFAQPQSDEDDILGLDKNVTLITRCAETNRRTGEDRKVSIFRGSLALVQPAKNCLKAATARVADPAITNYLWGSEGQELCICQGHVRMIDLVTPRCTSGNHSTKEMQTSYLMHIY